MAGSAEIVVRGACLCADLEGGPVDVAIIGESIAQVAAAGTIDGRSVLDADGLWLMPGVIDAHVHPIHDETFASIGAAAPYGGVTTVLHHLYPEPGESFAAAIARAEAGIAGGAADGGVHVRIRGDEMGLRPEAADGGRYAAIKLFLAHTDPAIEVDLGDVFEVMLWAAAHDALVYVHCEHGVALQRAEQVIGAARTLLEWSADRSDQLEAAAVAAVTALAELTGAALHVPHVSSAAALDVALAARRRGVRVTVETCPHYLFLTAESDLGGFGRCAPPLRAPADRDALRRALADGSIDLVATDHCGYDESEKSTSVAGSSNGLPGLETLLPLLLDAAIEGHWIDPGLLVEMLAGGPARAFGLAGKGAIAPGYDADLVLIDPTARERLQHRDMHDRAGYTPYEGWEVRGSVVEVMRRGERLVERGRQMAESPGRLVRVRRSPGRGLRPSMSPRH